VTPETINESGLVRVVPAQAPHTIGVVSVAGAGYYEETTTGSGQPA